MKPPKIVLVLSLFIFIQSAGVFGQDSLHNKNEEIKKSYFKLSTTYRSNAVYEGRKDSAVISYITPGISYVNKNGFNIAASLSYAPNPGINQIDVVSIESEYEHKLNKSLQANFSASAFMYNPYSTAVKSETIGKIAAGFEYSPKDIISVTASADMAVSKQLDVITTLAVNHPFYFGDTGHDWSVLPTVSVISGTQNYYQNYYTNRRFNQLIRGHGNKKGNGRVLHIITQKQVTVVSKNDFAVLDYELSLPVTLDARKVGFFFTPFYAIPQHPITYNEDGVNVNERLTNSFYFELGSYINF
jgi:hypothetical protein